MAKTIQTDAPKKRRWVKFLLFASLALNLLVVGVVAGALFRGKTEHAHPPLTARTDLGLGPYGKALSPADRRTVRRMVFDGVRSVSEKRADTRQEMLAVLAVLRTDPFDPQALRETMGQQQDRLVSVQNLGKDALLVQLADMGKQQRLDYADRLERALGRLLK